jgi:hypothetical protein
MAGGGIVSFAGDGDSYVPFDSSLEGAPHTMRVPYSSDETVDENADGGGNDHPRFDARDSAGDYRKTMEELFADQERQNKEYETKRAALGEAYANAEDRDKELSQRYADEERFQKGMPWISAGLALMQSTGRGISGLADAGTAGISALVSGREKLASLKDKQRDYMQTVTEARRAEKRGDLDKLRELQASLAGQRANMAGVAAQLGQGDRELAAKYDIANLEAGAKGGKGTDKNVAYVYLDRAMKLRDAADDPKNAAQRTAFLAKADEYNALGYDILYAGQGVEPKKQAAQQKALLDKSPNIAGALSLLKDPDPQKQAQGEQQLRVISGSTGVPVARIKELYGIGSTNGGASSAPMRNWEDAPDDEE